MADDALKALLDVLADAVAERVAERLTAGDTAGWIDQHSSPLGARKHCSLIRSGVIPGCKVGRRYLAKQKDLESYIAKQGSKQRRSTPQRQQEPRKLTDAELAAELGLALPANR
jgi:hypothetical protein